MFNCIAFKGICSLRFSWKWLVYYFKSANILCTELKINEYKILSDLFESGHLKNRGLARVGFGMADAEEDLERYCERKETGGQRTLEGGLWEPETVVTRTYSGAGAVDASRRPADKVTKERHENQLCVLQVAQGWLRVGGHAPWGALGGRAPELSRRTCPAHVSPRATRGTAGHQEDPHDRLPGRHDGMSTE